MGSREKELFDLNEPANGDEENKSSNPLNRTKQDQKKEKCTNSGVEKEEGEWSDNEGFNDANRNSSMSEMSTSGFVDQSNCNVAAVANTSFNVNNVKGENSNRASLGLDSDSNNLEDSVLVPKRREIRGAEQIHAVKIASDPRKRPKVDQQKGVMLGKKRSRQIMFLDLEDVKQAGSAKIPTPRRPNFLPPSTARFTKESRPVIDSSESNGEKVFDQSNNEGNNYVEFSETKSECDDDDDMNSGPVTRSKKTISETNLVDDEDKLFSDHKQSLLKQPADSRQMKNPHVPIKKPSLMSQNHIYSKALSKKLPSRKPPTVTNQYQDSSVERLLREVTNEKFWQHPELQCVPGNFDSVEEYVRVFEPLLFEECRAQLYSTWEELIETASRDSHTMVRVKNIERRERGWYDVILLPINECRWTFKEGDVAVLSTPKPGIVRSKRTITEESEISGHVAFTVRHHIPIDTRDPTGAVLHFFVGDSYDSNRKVDDDHILKKLQPKGVWFLTILGALATTQSEYIALHAFRRLNLQKTVKSLGIGKVSVRIITPYKLQLKCIQREFEEVLKSEEGNDLYINTVDAFQGQERDVIIMSCVRASGHGVGFVEDIRRMNVLSLAPKEHFE